MPSCVFPRPVERSTERAVWADCTACQGNSCLKLSGLRSAAGPGHVHVLSSLLELGQHLINPLLPGRIAFGAGNPAQIVIPLIGRSRLVCLQEPMLVQCGFHRCRHGVSGALESCLFLDCHRSLKASLTPESDRATTGVGLNKLLGNRFMAMHPPGAGTIYRIWLRCKNAVFWLADHR